MNFHILFKFPKKSKGELEKSRHFFHTTKLFDKLSFHKYKYQKICFEILCSSEILTLGLMSQENPECNWQLLLR